MKRSIVLILTVSLAVSATVSAGWIPSAFIRGDANLSSTVDMSDALAVLNYLYTAESNVDLDCLATADANGDDVIDISDPIFILSYLFLGGKAPPAPFPMEGTAAQDAALGCEVFEVETPAEPDSPNDVFNPDWFWVDNGWGNDDPWGTVGFGWGF